MNVKPGLLFCLFLLFSPVLFADEDLSARVSLGKLRLGLSGAEVVKLLGKPSSTGKDVMWEAIGEWVQEWNYPAHGLSLNMASGKKGGAKSVFSISAFAGCTLATARGIRIGSNEGEVRKAYGAVEDKESSVRGASFVAGSLYGGVIFRFEKGRVSDIFIGAAAE
jgi:hypothetical protein